MSVCEELRELRSHKVVLHDFTFLQPTVHKHVYKTTEVLIESVYELVVARFARVTIVQKQSRRDLFLLRSPAILN